MKRLIALSTILLLTACGGSPSGDKFPYPPQFVQLEQVSDSTLPAPPQPGSATYKREIKEIIARQKNLDKDEMAQIEHESRIVPEMLTLPVLGDNFTEENFPATYTLLKHAGSDAWRINDNIQNRWQQKRPFIADTRVKRFVEPIDRPGYPSGHTVTNTVWALVLGDMMPCTTRMLLNRASEIGYHRVDGGAHFPHDIEAGKKLARVIYHRMLENQDFLAERDEAQRELDANMPYGIPLKRGDTVESIDPGYIARCGAKPPLERPVAQ